jgi:DNA invertase Pin-like site-specific DNA recombinase
MDKVVSYLRVSTKRQGISGLGLEAQRAAVAGYMNGAALLAEFVEVESGTKNDRPKLTEALAKCRLTGATLLIAKLDRLSRNAAFLLGLQQAGVPFKAADMPHADSFTVGILALVAQREAEMTSQRTKAALAAAKARGVVLGGFRGTLPPAGLGAAANAHSAESFAGMVGPLVKSGMEAGKSLRAIAADLADAGIQTQRGGAWSAETVRSVWQRIQTVEAQ